MFCETRMRVSVVMRPSAFPPGRFRQIVNSVCTCVPRLEFRGRRVFLALQCHSSGIVGALIGYPTTHGGEEFFAAIRTNFFEAYGIVVVHLTVQTDN